MVYISPEKISQIQATIDIVDVISSYIPLKKSGQNYMSRCPFHEEKTASFSVSPERQMFHCFGCKEGGNVFHFIMAMDKVSFPEAVQIAAEKCSMPLDLSTSDQHPENLQITDLYKVGELASQFFQKCLDDPRHPYGLEYLSQRKISPESRKAFDLGLAPAGWDNFLSHGQREKVSLEVMEQAGLVVPRSKKDGWYDRFRSRLIFPISDGQGRVVGFGGRAFGDDHPKYLNSPESPIFNKGHLLYGFPQAKEEISSGGRVGIVEGYTDVIMAHQYGFPWVVATLGTAFTPHHAKLMKRFARQVYLIFDGDEAGKKASLRSLTSLLEEELEVRVVPLDQGYDPCDFLLKFGEEAFAKKVDQAVDFLDYFFEIFRREKDLSTPAGKGEALAEILPLVQKIRNPIVQDGLIQRLGEECSLSVQAIYSRMNSLGKKNFSRSKGSSFPQNRAPGQKNGPPQEEENIFKTLLRLPESIPEILELFPPEKFSHGPFQKIALQIQSWSQNREDLSSPLHAIPDEAEQKYIAGVLMEGSGGHEKKYNMKVVLDCVALLDVRAIQQELDQTQKKRNQALANKDYEALRELTQREISLRREQAEKKFTLPGKRLKN